MVDEPANDSSKTTNTSKESNRPETDASLNQTHPPSTKSKWLLFILIFILLLFFGFKKGLLSFRKKLKQPTPIVSTPPGAKPTGIVSKPAPKGLSCVTGVALPREDATSANSQKLRQEIQKIKQELGITIIWQLFSQNSTEADWKAAFDVARSEGVGLITALTTADEYTVACPTETSCSLGPTEEFLRFVSSAGYEDTLHGHLLVDEPYEDTYQGNTIQAAEVRDLYKKAKAITPNVNMIVGFSKEIHRFGSKPGYEFSDGMCDICLISALEVRNNDLREEILIPHQINSRRAIRTADPDALIYSSVQAFGNEGSLAAYSMPTADVLNQLLDALLVDPDVQAAGKLDGIMFQSWQAPTRNKVANQETLVDLDQGDERLQIVRDTCGT